MNSEYNSMKNENIPDELDLDDSGSIDDFLKELEKKEKDLDISSEMVVEIEDFDVQDESLVEIESLLETFHPNHAFSPSSPQLAHNHLLSNSKTFSDLEDEIAQLNYELNKISAERKEMSETMHRRSTDFENFRNRTERERAEIFRSVLSNLANKILPAIDNLDRALTSASSHGVEKSADFQQFIDGIGLVNQQLSEVLIEMGIQPIVSVGQPFNPHFHEAVATVQTDEVPHSTVIGELLRGYHIDNKVIRPSMVKVSSFPNPTNFTSSEMASDSDISLEID